MFSPPGSGPVYFNRPDVKAAINAPDKEWVFCNTGSTKRQSVFIDDTDLSLASRPGSQPVIPNVIDRTKNVIIGHGARDLVLAADSTRLGFQEKPSAPLIMLGISSAAQQNSGLGLTAGGGAGIVGTVHTERDLTYIGIETAGHFLTLDDPQVAFPGPEALLGRMDGLGSVAPFTVKISGRAETGS